MHTPEEDLPTEKELFSTYGYIRNSAASWAHGAAHFASRGDIDPLTGKTTSAFVRGVMNQIVLPMIEGTEGLPQLIANEVQAGAINAGKWAQLWAHFYANDTEAFEFSKELVAQAWKSAVSDWTFSKCRPPIPAFFVHFGVQPNLNLPWEDQSEYVDGTYYSFQYDKPKGQLTAVVLGLTTRLKNGRGFLTPGPRLVIEGNHLALPWQAAIDAAAAELVKQARQEGAGFKKSNPRGPVGQVKEALVALASESADIFKRAAPLLVGALTLLPTRFNAPFQVDQELRAGVDVGLAAAQSTKALKELRFKLFQNGLALVRYCDVD